MMSSRLVEVGTTTLCVRERSGPGSEDRPALVFLHYFGGSGRTWEPVADTLAAAGWRCVAPDLRGFGESPAPGDDWTHFTVDTMADDIHGLVGRLKLGRFIVIGHSMGGKIALALAAHRPAGLAGVILLSPSPATPEPMKDAARARLLAGWGDAAAMAETLREITARPLPGPVFDAAVADHLRATAPAWRAWLEHGSRKDISARLGQINAPVSIVVGGEDQAITGGVATRGIAAFLTSLETPLETLPGIGHLMPLEAPGETVGLLLKAFARFDAVRKNPQSD